MNEAILLAIGALLFVAWNYGAAQQAAGLFDAMSEPLYDQGLAPWIYDLARAIARAEGFGIAGVIPTRANNPGDLVPPDWNGPRLGTAGVAVYPTAGEGWAALYHQIGLIAQGRSRVYAMTDSIAEMAVKWTGGDAPDAWAANVASALGVTVDHTLSDVANL